MSVLEKFTHAVPADAAAYLPWWETIAEHDRYVLLEWLALRCATSACPPLHVWGSQQTGKSLLLEACRRVVLDFGPVGARTLNVDDGLADVERPRGALSASKGPWHGLCAVLPPECRVPLQWTTRAPTKVEALLVHLLEKRAALRGESLVRPRLNDVGADERKQDAILKLSKDIHIPARQNFSVAVDFFPFAPPNTPEKP